MDAEEKAVSLRDAARKVGQDMIVRVALVASLTGAGEEGGKKMLLTAMDQMQSHARAVAKSVNEDGMTVQASAEIMFRFAAQLMLDAGREIDLVMVSLDVVKKTTDTVKERIPK